MTRKRLLCIAAADVDSAALLCGAMADWEIRKVSALHQATRALREQHYPVGLLAPTRRQYRAAELDMSYTIMYRLLGKHSVQP